MKNKKTITINIVPSFHYDIAYLKTCEEYLEICLENIDQALRILDRYQDYNFTIEQVYLLKEYWNRNPGKREALKKFIDEGRLSIAPGMLAIPDMNLPDGESMYMQIKVGKDWLKEALGIDPDVCYIADCWGHHAQLPQIVTQSGYKYYVFWRCMRRDVLSNDFIWEGLDGTRINTHWLSKGYSGVSFPDDSKKLNVRDLDLSGNTREKIILLCEEIRKYGNEETVMAFNGGDFAHPQISAPGIIEEYNKVGDGYTMQFSTPKKHLQSVPWHEMKVVEGEFNTSQQGTFTTNIRIKQIIRKLVNDLHSVERLSVILRKKLDCQNAWEPILKQQFHDIICGSICDGALLDAYNEMRLAEKLIYEKKAEIESGTGIVAFFNPLGFERKEVVEVDGNKYMASTEPFGFAPLKKLQKITETDAPQLPYTFENSYYRAVIDKDGYISSLLEKETDTELVKGGPIHFGSIGMQMDYGDVWLNFEGPISGGSIEASLTQNRRDPYSRGSKDDIVNRRTLSAEKVLARIIECNEEQIVIEQTGEFEFWEIIFPVKTTITFQKNTRDIMYRTSILPNGKNYRLRAAFPTSIDRGVIRHEIPFGIQERDQAEYPCQNWMDYQDDKAGLAVLNRGIPANNVDEGIMMLTLFRSVAMEYKTESHLSYNHGVPHEFNYSILPHKAGRDVDIIRTAMAFNQPLVLCNVDENAISGKNAFSIDRENVFISGLRWQDSMVFLRIYEGTGQHTKCRVGIPESFSEVAEADGLQRAKTGFSSCGEEMEIDIKAFEVKNYLFKYLP